MFPKVSLFTLILFGLIINNICTPPHSPQPSTSSSKDECCKGASNKNPTQVKSLPYDRQQEAVNTFLDSIDNSEIFTPEWRVSESEPQPSREQFDGMLRCPHSSCAAKKFKSKSKLREHERIHTGERPFNCDICGASFNKKTAIKRHINTIHKSSDDKTFQCKYCGGHFKRVDNMNLHIDRVHNKKQ